MGKKPSKSAINQIICYALILAAVLGIVTIILVAEGTYAWEGIWCGLASTLVLALAGAWYGWNNAKLPRCRRKGRIHIDRAYHLGNDFVRPAIHVCVNK